MKNDEMLRAAKLAVLKYTNKHLEETGKKHRITMDDVFVVWFCKTLQNWKALVSTTLPDHMFYEITYNGDQLEMYLDSYKKQENVKLSIWQSNDDGEMHLSRKE